MLETSSFKYWAQLSTVLVGEIVSVGHSSSFHVVIVNIETVGNVKSEKFFSR